MLALDVLLVVACVVDFRLTPAPALLDVRRRAPGRVGLSQLLVRTVSVHAPEAAGLELELHEEFSPTFQVAGRTRGLPERRLLPHDDVTSVLEEPVEDDPTGGPDEARVPESGTCELRRAYRPTVRGVHVLGDMRLALKGRLGLLWRQARLYGDQDVQVEPPLLGLKNILKLAASERWHDLGVRYLRRRGGMTEFESLREYVHGEDVRLVDWKAFAKRGRPIVRQYQEEKGQEMILLIDCGRRMGATTAEGSERGWTKLDHALDAALQIAAVALQNGDRVGALAFDGRVRAFVAPVRGQAQLRRLRDALFDLEPSELESDISRALRELAVRKTSRALLLVLSDVADPLSLDRQRRALLSGTRRHRVVFAGLDDPSLRKAAAGGHPDARVRAAAGAIIEERRLDLTRLSQAGVRVIDSLPAETAAPLLAAWLDARRSGL